MAWEPYIAAPERNDGRNSAAKRVERIMIKGKEEKPHTNIDRVDRASLYVILFD